MRKVSVVIPAYNEDKNVPLIALEVSAVLDGYDWEIIFVDDGSTDGTLEALRSLHSANPRIKFLSFSRNFGHQYALKAGIDHANGDCVIMMDGDMQHPPRLLPAMLQKWDVEKYDVVFSSREDSSELSFFKRNTSHLFYVLMNSLSDVHLENGTADFRLIDRKVVDIISKLNDPFLFLRGLVPWVGFRQYKMMYTPDKRHSGETKYSLVKMIRFALNGITSFSIKPLRLATLLGVLISLLAFLYGFYAVIYYFVSDKAISGWASVLTSILFIGGIQLLMIGIIGEYIGKIYTTLKNRPSYIIQEKSTL